ncbi:glycosyltransferase family 2 protein [Candidatus Woesearchaeota archaeon CG_4_10_14_0_2_um_filter_57_5]|nr:MAG: glycosyltransferase family 2 protein [Candidatus Woesearchaeota archaeon CG_4_10_14_0_2_um_filter_57_5]
MNRSLRRAPSASTGRVRAASKSLGGTKNRRIAHLKRVAIVPAYNEEQTIAKVIKDLKAEGFVVLVINDSSADATAAVARKAGATVYSHPINRGLGGALGTGFAAALANDADILVTVDADGQHLARDARRVADTVASGYDAVIGSRLIGTETEGMPFVRKAGNRVLNILTYLLFGVRCSDTQSGLRGFSRAGAQKISIRTNRMEVSSEIIKEIGRNKLRTTEIPIKAIYTDYSLRKGQRTLNGIRIMGQLFWQKLTR